MNVYLLSWCKKEKEKHLDKWLEEQKALRPLPVTSFSAERPKSVKVNSYALVTMDRNKYSVPSQYTGQLLLAKACVDRVGIIHLGQIVAKHPRCYDRG